MSSLFLFGNSLPAVGANLVVVGEMLVVAASVDGVEGLSSGVTVVAEEVVVPVGSTLDFEVSGELVVGLSVVSVTATKIIW